MLLEVEDLCVFLELTLWNFVQYFYLFILWRFSRHIKAAAASLEYFVKQSLFRLIAHVRGIFVRSLLRLGHIMVMISTRSSTWISFLGAFFFFDIFKSMRAFMNEVKLFGIYDREFLARFEWSLRYRRAYVPGILNEWDVRRSFQV